MPDLNLEKVTNGVGAEEIVPKQVALARENSAVMKNIADATDILTFSPIRRNIFDSMLP